MTGLRPLLIIFGFCWLLVGIANLEVSMAQRWHPEIVGVLGLGCSVCTFVVAAIPRIVLAYRIGGTLAIGTLCARVSSIVLGLLEHDSRDTPWITLATASVAAMLAILYWRWWLADVKSWHEAHKTIRDYSHDSG